MIGDKIYYYVGAGLVSLVVIYIIIQLFNLHFKANKSFMEQFSIIEGFSLPGSEKLDSEKPGKKSVNKDDDTETTYMLETHHKDLKAKINVLTKELDTIGKDEIENYLLDVDEYIDLATIANVIFMKDPLHPKWVKALVNLTFYKKTIENAVKYLNSETSQMANPETKSGGVSIPGSLF